MSSESDTLRGRIEELEVHAAFQARTVEQLDEVVRDFSARVVRLERELRELRGQLEASGTVAAAAADADEPDDANELEPPDARDVG